MLFNKICLFSTESNKSQSVSVKSKTLENLAYMPKSRKVALFHQFSRSQRKRWGPIAEEDTKGTKGAAKGEDAYEGKGYPEYEGKGKDQYSDHWFGGGDRW